VGTAAGEPTGELVYAAPTFGNANFDVSQSGNMTNTNGSLGGPIFEGLFMFMPPDGKLKPFLLQSYEEAPDHSSWTFKLRPGITFSNGDPMTADDIKFSLGRTMADDSKDSSAGLLRSQIDHIDVVDPLTVRIAMKMPNIDLPNTLTSPGNDSLVLPSKYYQQVGPQGFSQNPIGSGPYTFVSMQAGQSVKFEANPNYWGGPSGDAKPVFKNITVLAIPEEQTRINLLKTGQADLVPISPDSIADVQAAGFKILAVPKVSNYMIYFAGLYGDAPDTPVRNPLVRKALTLALDKQALADALVAGVGQPGNINPPPDVVPDSPQLPPTPYDPEQAKALLAQAGYPSGFTLTYNATDVCGTPDWGSAVASYWQKIGVTTEVVPVSFATFRAKIQPIPSAPDIAGQAWTFCTGNLGGSVAAITDGSFYSKAGVFHLTDVADAEMEKRFAATTLEERTQDFAAVYQKVYDDYTAIGVFTFAQVFAVSKKAENYPLTAATTSMLSWWVTNHP
jgi:peptide/nickel transport system substrate-binding protein